MPSRYLLVFIVLLCALASALAWESTRQLERASTVSFRSESRQLVREYYANLNVFLSTGEIDPLLSLFAGDLDPRALPGCEQFEMVSRWRALRATYPDMSVRIRDEGAKGAESIIGVAIESSYTVIPDWLHLDASGTPDRAVEWFGTSGAAIVDFRSTMQPPLALELTEPNVATHVNRESSLVIVRLEFLPGQRTYERLPGPGLLLLTDGELELVTDPTHFVALVRDDSSDLAEPVQILRPGDAATAAKGDLVVRNSGQSPVSALYVSLRSHSGPDEMGREPGDGRFEGTGLEGSRSTDHAQTSDAGTAPSLSSTLVQSGDDVNPGMGELHVAIVLTDEHLGTVPGVAKALLRGPLDTAGGCGDGRSMYLVAAYIPTP